MKKTIFYGAVLIGIYVLVANATGSGTVIGGGIDRRHQRDQGAAGPVRKTFPPVWPAFLRELVYGAEPVGAAGAAVLDKYAKGTVSGGPMGGIRTSG